MTLETHCQSEIHLHSWRIFHCHVSFGRVYHCFLMGFISYKCWLLPDFMLPPVTTSRFPHCFYNLWDLGSNGSRSRYGTAIDRVSELKNEESHWKVNGWVKICPSPHRVGPYEYIYICIPAYVYASMICNGPVSGYGSWDESPTSILGNEVPRA